MSDRAPPARERRRHVRLGCLLVINGRTLTGHTVSLTPDSFQLVLRSDSGSTQLPEMGESGLLRLFLLDEESPLTCMATVSWADRGTGLTSMGAATLSIEPRLEQAERARLSAFLEHFRYTVLAVDPDAGSLKTIKAALKDVYQVIRCGTGEEALQQLETSNVAAMVVSERLPDLSCTDFLRRSREKRGAAHVASLVSYLKSTPPDIEALTELGQVSYYLAKPFRTSELQQVVRHGVEAFSLSVENARLRAELERANRKLSRENRFLKSQAESYQGFKHLVGQSAELRNVLSQLECLRPTDTVVHLQGESGTGKELVARALHFGGPRASKPFVAQSCGALTESLMQSTLFGHKRGAFTGASRDHPGVFEQANGGTLFLDEVAELTPATQASLLRALQEGEVTPLGARQSIRVNVRIISASRSDLRAEVQKGRFREDLFFRLVVVPVRLPPLRERQADIHLLVQHFLQLQCQRQGRPGLSFEPEVLTAFSGYSWPGNIRQLEHEIERLVVLADDHRPIPLRLLSPEISAQTSHPAPSTEPPRPMLYIPKGLTFDESVERLSRELVERAFKEAGGKVTAAAAQLKIERSRLGKLRERLGISSIAGEPVEGDPG